MTGVENSDIAPADCRPYRVVLLTDGLETCGGDPEGAAAALLSAGMPVYVIGLVVAALTAFYMTRAVFLTFFGEYRGTAHPHESPRSMTGSEPISAAVFPWRCTLTLGWNQVSRPRSFTRCRHHQTRSLVFVFPGVIVFDENISCVIDQTSAFIFSK